jgi:hypothetical protein
VTRNVGTENEDKVDSIEARIHHQIEKFALGPESDVFEGGEDEIVFVPK